MKTPSNEKHFKSFIQMHNSKEEIKKVVNENDDKY